MFYGSPETDPAVLKKASCPVLGLFGEEDQGIPADRINAMAKGLKEFGKGAEVKVYPGAGHAFFNEKRPSYNAEAAADAWKRTLAFFKTNLKG
jgi:carboxymethylenebutenolidase